MKTLAIGIPTYNRPRLLEFCAKSISRVRSISDIDILVIDDDSSEFDLAFLKEQFPTHAKIIRNIRNSGGADIAIRNIMSQLVQLDVEYILILDSDMIIRSDFYQILLSNLSDTDGILSLFNTHNHPGINLNENLVQKFTIGSAGTVYSRKIAQLILDNVPEGDSFDFRYCKFLTSNNYKLYSLKHSAVQHLGFSQGQNSNYINGDIGLGFSDVDIENAYSMIEFIQLENQIMLKNLKRNSFSQRLKRTRRRIRQDLYKLLGINYSK